MRVPHVVSVVPEGPDHWWQSLDSGDWLGALVNGLSILVAILVAVYLTPKSENRKARRDSQERLLRVLVNTWLLPANAEYQSAIALLPLDFKGCKNILDARNDLLDLANVEVSAEQFEANAHHERTREKQAYLIELVAREVGYDLSAQSLLDGAYLTKGFVDRELLLNHAMMAWPRIADALERSNELIAPMTREQDSVPDGGAGPLERESDIKADSTEPDGHA